MLTGQACLDMAAEAMKLGAIDFLTNQIVQGKLKLLIEKVLGAERTAKTLAYYRDRETRLAPFPQPWPMRSLVRLIAKGRREVRHYEIKMANG
jgi:DNA-binding NtrC family response regulator